MARERQRDAKGNIVPTLWEKFTGWRLGRKLRKGQIPRGKKITSAQAKAAIDSTLRGHITEIWGLLSVRHIREDGGRTDLGLVDCRKITTAFRDYIVDSLQDSTSNPLDAFKYHASGTGVTAESNAQTALVTEVANRVSGTQIEGNTSDIYKTVGTISYSGAFAVTEHGIFSAASSGTMMDRSVFAAINVASGDAIEFTYEATFNAEP